MIALPASGTIFAGRYRLKDGLEQHALGGLFTAVYEPFETHVFLELIQPERVPPAGSGREQPSSVDVDDFAPGRELRECLQRAAQIHGPHLCGLIEWFEEGGFICIASEHAAGVTLRELLDEVGNLPLGQGLEVFHACVEAAGAAYGSGIYYLALDPRNLLITPSGPVKLMRAGYFHLLESADPILRHESMLYRSREAVRGQPGRSSDVYAMTVMLREMLGPSRPAGLEGILARATAADPASRPAARPLLEALAEEAARLEKGFEAPMDVRVRQRVDAGFPRPAPGATPSGRRRDYRRYLIILAVLLLAAYLMARFIGGCRPEKTDSLLRAPRAQICTGASAEPLQPAYPAS